MGACSSLTSCHKGSSKISPASSVLPLPTLPSRAKPATSPKGQHPELKHLITGPYTDDDNNDWEEREIEVSVIDDSDSDSSEVCRILSEFDKIIQDNSFGEDFVESVLADDRYALEGDLFATNFKVSETDFADLGDFEDNFGDQSSFTSYEQVIKGSSGLLNDLDCTLPEDNPRRIRRLHPNNNFPKASTPIPGKDLGELSNFADDFLGEIIQEASDRLEKRNNSILENLDITPAKLLEPDQENISRAALISTDRELKDNNNSECKEIKSIAPTHLTNPQGEEGREKENFDTKGNKIQDTSPISKGDSAPLELLACNFAGELLENVETSVEKENRPLLKELDISFVEECNKNQISNQEAQTIGVTAASNTDCTNVDVNSELQNTHLLNKVAKFPTSETDSEVLQQFAGNLSNNIVKEVNEELTTKVSFSQRNPKLPHTVLTQQTEIDKQNIEGVIKDFGINYTSQGEDWKDIDLILKSLEEIAAEAKKGETTSETQANENALQETPEIESQLLEELTDFSVKAFAEQTPTKVSKKDQSSLKNYPAKKEEEEEHIVFDKEEVVTASKPLGQITLGITTEKVVTTYSESENTLEKFSSISPEESSHLKEFAGNFVKEIIRKATEKLDEKTLLKTEGKTSKEENQNTLHPITQQTGESAVSSLGVHSDISGLSSEASSDKFDKSMSSSQKKSPAISGTKGANVNPKGGQNKNMAPKTKKGSTAAPQMQGAAKVQAQEVTKTNPSADKLNSSKITEAQLPDQNKDTSAQPTVANGVPDSKPSSDTQNPTITQETMPNAVDNPVQANTETMQSKEISSIIQETNVNSSQQVPLKASPEVLESATSKAINSDTEKPVVTNVDSSDCSKQSNATDTSMCRQIVREGVLTPDGQFVEKTSNLQDQKSEQNQENKSKNESSVSVEKTADRPTEKENSSGDQNIAQKAIEEIAMIKESKEGGEQMPKDAKETKDEAGKLDQAAAISPPEVDIQKLRHYNLLLRLQKEMAIMQVRMSQLQDCMRAANDALGSVMDNSKDFIGDI